MQAVIVRHIFAFLFSFAGAFYLIPIMIKTAQRLRFLDVPDGKIKLHTGAVPYLGGVAVFMAFLATLGLVYPFDNNMLWFLVGTTLLFFVGLIDDLAVLKPYQKFAAQSVAALSFLKGGFALRMQFFSEFFNVALSLLWILTVINAFNLVDVMDGLSTTLALSSALVFFGIALSTQQYALSLLIIAFMGPLLAFFYYNKPSARIYLGDAGSMFVGGFLAAMPLLFSWSTFHLQGYFVPVAILAVPLLEIACLVVIRTGKGIPFYQGSPHHFSMFLRNKGWSVYSVLAFSACSTLLFSFIGLGFLNGIFSFMQFLVVCSPAAFLWLYIVYFAGKKRIEVSVHPARLNKNPEQIPSRGRRKRKES